MSIPFVKYAPAIAVTTLVTLMAGCTTTGGGTSYSPSAQQAEDRKAAASRKVTVNTAESIKKNWGASRLFALIEPKGDEWVLVSVSEKYPVRKDQQEIFLVTRDLSLWETTIPNEKSCQTQDRAGYSVCSSVLARERNISDPEIGASALAASMTGKEAAGKSMHYDPEAVSRAVMSISEGQAKAVVATFFTAQAAEKKRKADEERAQRRADCVERYEAETRELNAAAARARAAMNAGKQLSLAERADIARAQTRMSAFSSCSF